MDVPIFDDAKTIAAAKEASEKFLSRLAKHHPRRAGEIVNTPNGICIIGGTAQAPRLIPGHTIRPPESGQIQSPTSPVRGVSVLAI